MAIDFVASAQPSATPIATASALNRPRATGGVPMSQTNARNSATVKNNSGPSSIAPR